MSLENIGWLLLGLGIGGSVGCILGAGLALREEKHRQMLRNERAARYRRG